MVDRGPVWWVGEWVSVVGWWAGIWCVWFIGGHSGGWGWLVLWVGGYSHVWEVRLFSLDSVSVLLEECWYDQGWGLRLGCRLGGQ